MAKKSKLNIAKLTALLISVLFLLKCANQLPPSGGEEDLIPPAILEVYPANGTTNFNDNYFELTFSEYVDRRSVQQSIFISPEIEGTLEYDWSGTSVELTFEDTLLANTTYTVTVGTGVADVRKGNHPSEPFSFAFSTGSTIDEGEITGQIYDKDPQGMVVLAYPLNNTEYNPMEIKPGYRSQVGENGKFKFVGLAPGGYRVIALKDEFMNFIYNIEEDEYGVPSSDVKLSEKIPVFTDLDFMLTKEDTTPPNILNITMTDRHHFLIEFSEFIDSTRMSPDNFYLFDSTDQSKINTYQVFKSLNKPLNYFATIIDSLDENKDYFFIAENIFDNAGNLSEQQATSFTVNSLADTTSPELITILTAYENNKIDYNDPELTLKFNDGLDTLSAKKGITIFDERKRPILFGADFIDGSSIKLRFTTKVQPKSEFTLNLNLAYFIDIAGNKIDSVKEVVVSTVNDLDFSGVSGKVFTADSAENIIVMLSSTENDNKLISAKADDEFNYKFENVIPGKYLIWSFIDADKNGRYSYGKVYPIEFSEHFVFYPDTLNLRARWPVGDVYLNFK